MALIQCSECGRQISDKAAFCPQCGCPPTTSTQANDANVSKVSDAISEMERLISELHASTVDPRSAQRVADQISQIKSASFESKALFLTASLKAGVLILSDDDLDLLASPTEEDVRRGYSTRRQVVFHPAMSDEQVRQISRIYAISCSKLSDDVARAIWGFRNLEVLDLSYCENVSSVLFSALRMPKYSPGPTLLKEVYLRACRRIDATGVATLARHCPYFASLYIDGNPQIDTMAILVGRHIPGLQVLSIRGCRQICTREFRELFARNAPSCKIVM